MLMGKGAEEQRDALLYGPVRSLLETNTSGSLVNEYIFFGGKRIFTTAIPPCNTQYYFADQTWQCSGGDERLRYDFEDCDYFRTVARVALLQRQQLPVHRKERDSESGLDNFGARYDFVAVWKVQDA